MAGNVRDTIGSTMEKHTIPDQHQIPLLSSDKKRKVTGVNGTVDDLEDDKENKASNTSTKDWEELFHALQAERVTKAEALLHAYVRESEERESLMRSYNQELENANQKLRATKSNSPEQNHQREQELQNQVQALQSQVAQQDATIRAYQQLTGTTLSNIRVPPKLESETKNSTDQTATGLANNSKEGESNSIHGTLDCVCTVQNTETNVKTKFRISTVPAVLISGEAEDNKKHAAVAPSFLKYQSLENNEPLPDFLQEEIEFESTQLPQLMQNVLRGIFPEDEE
jgi:hypothetical protein